MAIRGIFTVTGRTFAVAGPDFTEIMANGTSVVRGTVSNNSLPVTMAASPQQLLLTSAGTAYVFDLTANTLTTIAAATFSGPVAQCGICDDFFIVTIKNSKEFVVSAPLDATDWVTNGSAIVSVFPDNIISFIVSHRELWFFSDTKTVVYYDSGNVFPFDVIPGSDMDQGCAAEFSTALLANTIFWLGADERGNGVVWMANGYTPQRISNHAVEFALQGYTRIDDAIALTIQDQGHYFYVLYFPTPSTTWVYDTATGMWHQRGYFNTIIAQFKAARYQNHTFNFGKHLVGDWASDLVYELHIPVQNQNGSWSFATDNGNLIHRVRRAPHISNEQRRQAHFELQVLVETGLGPVPPLLAGGPPMLVPVFTDTFTRADENPITPANYTVCASRTTFQVVSNLCEASNIHQTASELYTGATFPAGFGQYAEITIAALADNADAGVFVFADLTLDNCYAAIVINNSGVATLAIVVSVNGIQTLGSSATGVFLSNDVLRVEVINGQAILYWNGVAKTAVTGATIGAGQPGIDGDAGISVSDFKISKFICGYIAGGGAPRGPQMNLRWSDDSGKTWSNSYARDCGQVGEYQKRVRWLRLGNPRDRIYEIEVSDPIGWRLVDAYLRTEQGTGV